MKVFLALRYADFKETVAGLVCIVKTLGWLEGCRATAFATKRHLVAIWRGEGLYPEKAKQRVWLKLHYLKEIYEYLQLLSEEGE